MVMAQQPEIYETDTSMVSDEETVAPPVEEFEEEAYEEPIPFYLPEDSLRDIRSKKEYDYMKNLDSLLRNLNINLAEEPKEESRSVFDLSFIKVLIWGLAIFAVLYMLFQLFAGQQSLFSRNKKLEIMEDEEPHSTAGQSPLILSQQAAARGDYRQAVRYQYMYLLQLLAEKQMIVPQPQKTNTQYLAEMRQRPFAGEFANLTLQYEYVWYGGFQLTKEQYAMVEGGFRKFIGTWL
jgi:hypothetical protein